VFIEVVVAPAAHASGSSRTTEAVTPVGATIHREASANVALTSEIYRDTGRQFSSIRGRLDATQPNTGSHQRTGSRIEHRSGGSSDINSARNDPPPLAGHNVDRGDRPHPHWAARAATVLSAT
jgi:hypothetical protein